MLLHGPRVTADNLADSYASDVATHMNPWQQQRTQTSRTHVCAWAPIGTLQSSSVHPATADGEIVAKSGSHACRPMTV